MAIRRNKVPARELSIVEKKKRLNKETLITGIVVSLIVFYFGMAFEKVDTITRGTFTEKIDEMISQMSTNPLFVFPINYSTGIAWMLTIIVAVIITIHYSYSYVRINSGDEAKGKTF
ncbi:hypothetical protein, partial [Pseudobutyrivibrio sp.]